MPLQITIYKGNKRTAMKKCIQNRYFILTALLLLCFAGYSVSRVYGFVLFPDEFGYWSYAAHLAGYDWSDMTSLGSYYSYGYSLILFPIFILCKNAITAYRVAVLCNYIFLLIAFGCLQNMLCRLCKTTQISESEQNKERIVLFAAVAVFYPSNLFYATMTMTETLLVACYVIIVCLMYDYLSENKVSTLILLVLMLVYIFFVHMRAVGVLAAGVITIFLHFIMKSGKRKQILLVAGLGMAVLLAGYLMKRQISDRFYTDSSINDFSGQIEKIQSILSLEGLHNLLTSIIGKLLYLGLATYGLFYWGIFGLIRALLHAIRNARKNQILFILFLLMTIAAQIMVTAIYLIKPQRIDCVTYGRYNEFILAPVIALGAVFLWKSRKAWLGVLIIALAELLAMPVVINCIKSNSLTDFQGYFMAGIGYLYQRGNFEPIRFYWQTYGLCILLMLVMTAMIRYTGWKKERNYILMLALILQIGLAVRLSIAYTDAFNQAAYRDSVMADKLEQLKEGRRIVYLESNGLPLIDIMQFMMRDTDIIVLPQKTTVAEYTGELQESDLVLVNGDSSYCGELEQQYERMDVYGHFALFYTE